MSRVARTTPTFPDINLLIPVDHKIIMAKTPEEDCFSREWEPESRECVMCADNLVCGVMFNEHLKKVVAKREQEHGGYMDSNKFECIDRGEVKQWLAMKPRTFEQFVAKIQKFSESADIETTEFWCKSFIKETNGVSLKAGIVIVK